MNILTFDLEDWFHILDFKDTAHPAQWEKFENRVERNTERILEILNRKNLTATFFCLGWIARKYPDLIRKVSQHHEIACHSMDHQLLFLQDRKEFREDLRKSISLLEDLSGKKVTAYRAPGFSFTRNHQYVLEELSSAGIKIDCSVFPAARNHGGIPDFSYHEPCLFKSSGFSIVEFPMNTVKLFTREIVFSGGGYFRLLPYTLIRSWMKEAGYVMTYFHPRDFDPGQPRLKNLSFRRKWMSYVGLNSSQKKLEQLLTDFPFVSLGQAYSQLDLNRIPVVTL